MPWSPTLQARVGPPGLEASHLTALTWEWRTLPWPSIAFALSPCLLARGLPAPEFDGPSMSADLRVLLVAWTGPFP